jgi:signal transduction histidine kinase
MNYAQLIQDKIGEENPLSEYTSEIIHETERVSKIVKNLLVFARQEKESHSPARIKDIIDDTMSLIQTVLKRDQITLIADISEDLPKIKCRSQQIQQVVMNLLTNARDALNEKYPGFDDNKLIKITSKLFKKDGNRKIRTTIEDHGVGIDPKICETIFDPFFTTKDRTVGTGLGLSISYGIMKDHYGELSVESEPGQYTKFHMDLPVENG